LAYVISVSVLSCDFDSKTPTCIFNRSVAVAYMYVVASSLWKAVDGAINRQLT